MPVEREGFGQAIVFRMTRPPNSALAEGLGDIRKGVRMAPPDPFRHRSALSTERRARKATITFPARVVGCSELTARPESGRVGQFLARLPSLDP